ncbi:sigma-54-dependent Fis family transcriptional regulator [Alteromonas sediminis]|uniref:Sigma-54-dependent Fis family transcriptional regulator n=1 Tax=Alteromonas sediminis TaxID=2259342 RepID=A0A3N5Y2V0_9ALTE|nr:sigma-54 dependent transcriptional regulator [Alteromonas sediminis]RPJ67006.1 sigma-54-dependent Fis family transcriptional regulator [Alteromonas sediminis]
MQRPKLFLHINDRETEHAILSSDIARKFLLAKSSEFEPWVEQVKDSQTDMAIIEANDFTEHDLHTLKSASLHLHTEFIFLSRGEPNVFLDKFMKLGAGYHLRSPYEFKTVQTLVDDFYEDGATAQSNTKKIHSSSLNQFGHILGSSSCMLKLFRTLRKVANSDLNVLVMGESGAGKELIAQTLHDVGVRADGPFVALNCGAISPELIDSELFGHVKGAFTGAHKDHTGLFEQAKGGTLFLDEVTEMPIEHQVKLLRVLELGEFRPVGSNTAEYADVRIVAATNRDPSDAVADGILREDLYYRLAQIPVHVPPLRERSDDVIGLTEHFLAYRNAVEETNKSISQAALNRIVEHDWPGNVRELKHAVERAFVMADNVIEETHLTFVPLTEKITEENTVPTGIPLADIEREAILNTLEENKGSKKRTADQLGITVKTLYNKLEKYDQQEE